MTWLIILYKVQDDTTNYVSFAFREDSDQPSLIRVFTVCMKKAKVHDCPLSHGEDAGQTG